MSVWRAVWLAIRLAEHRQFAEGREVTLRVECHSRSLPKRVGERDSGVGVRDRAVKARAVRARAVRGLHAVVHVCSPATVLRERGWRGRGARRGLKRLGLAVPWFHRANPTITHR